MGYRSEVLGRGATSGVEGFLGEVGGLALLEQPPRNLRDPVLLFLA
jgi:hypothetical protein